MKKNRVLFIGSQNVGHKPDDGETMKNLILSRELEKYVDVINRIDMRNRPMRNYYMIKLLFMLLFFRNSKIVMSASPFVANTLFNIMKVFRWKGECIYYWVIGGTFGKLVQDKKIQSLYYLTFKKIIVEGDLMKQQLLSEGFKNVVVLPNIKDISYMPKKETHRHNIFKFVFLSRVMPQKGVDYIVEAASILNKKGVSNFLVDIYGRIDSEYETTFENELKDVINVQYKGFLYLDKSSGYDILSSYDIMLFPTYWHGEGFPGIIIDAFVSGLPIIATDWNLNKSLINEGETGILIPVHDVDALAKAMEDAINQKYDIQRMSKNAQAEAHKYEASMVINSTLLNNFGLIE